MGVLKCKSMLLSSIKPDFTWLCMWVSDISYACGVQVYPSVFCRERALLRRERRISLVYLYGAGESEKSPPPAEISGKCCSKLDCWDQLVNR